MLHAWLFLWVLSAAPDPAGWTRAAVAAEARGDYARAAELYARIVSDAGDSYFARKARSRLTELQAHADFGYAPYRRMQDVLQRYATLGSDRAIAEVRAIVDEYPASAVAPEALYWIGNEYREMRSDSAAALGAYRELADKYPNHPLVVTALDRMGRLLEARGKFIEARKIYEEMRGRFPEGTAAVAFEARRNAATRKLWHKRAARAAVGVLAMGALLFFAVGGYRVRRERVWAAFWPKAAFALVLGVLPAAFLAYYDGIWSPSLTAVGLLFAGYAMVLALLAARAHPPASPAVRILERGVFGVMAPVAIWVLVLHKFRLWEAFFL